MRRVPLFPNDNICCCEQKFFAVVAVCLFAVAAAELADLSKDQFEAVVHGDKDAFVKFYAPCECCRGHPLRRRRTRVC